MHVIHAHISSCAIKFETVDLGLFKARHRASKAPWWLAMVLEHQSQQQPKRINGRCAGADGRRTQKPLHN